MLREYLEKDKARRDDRTLSGREIEKRNTQEGSY
jgi:hypothetical protein